VRPIAMMVPQSSFNFSPRFFRLVALLEWDIPLLTQAGESANFIYVSYYRDLELKFLTKTG
jgi:hypothetical protein